MRGMKRSAKRQIANQTAYHAALCQWVQKRVSMRAKGIAATCSEMNAITVVSSAARLLAMVARGMQKKLAAKPNTPHQTIQLAQ